jgi:C4-dicarboxylate transporter DctM subunit
VGGTLFVSARLAQVGIGKVSYALIPMFGVTLVVLFLITYIEALPMGLVWLLR